MLLIAALVTLSSNAIWTISSAVFCFWIAWVNNSFLTIGFFVLSDFAINASASCVKRKFWDSAKSAFTLEISLVPLIFFNWFDFWVFSVLSTVKLLVIKPFDSTLFSIWTWFNSFSKVDFSFLAKAGFSNCCFRAFSLSINTFNFGLVNELSAEEFSRVSTLDAIFSFLLFAFVNSDSNNNFWSFNSWSSGLTNNAEFVFSVFKAKTSI